MIKRIRIRWLRWRRNCALYEVLAMRESLDHVRYGFGRHRYSDAVRRHNYYAELLEELDPSREYEKVLL